MTSVSDGNMKSTWVAVQGDKRSLIALVSTDQYQSGKPLTGDFWCAHNKKSYKKKVSRREHIEVRLTEEVCTEGFDMRA